MKKVILGLVVILTFGVVGTVSAQKAAAATYSINRYIHRLPGAGMGQHEIQD